MSVYPNQTNATPSSSFFAAAGSGGGSASDWSLYPAISTITYSGAGGLAYFSGLVVDEGMNIPIIEVSTITATGISVGSLGASNLNVSSINNAIYPPASSSPIVGTLPIPADNTTLTSEIAGVTSSSVITGIYTSSDTSVIITSLIPGTNEITINLSGAAPSGSRFNYAIFPAAT